MTKIQLISGPRNISTALMYSFGNRSKCTIVDEPFYAYYLNKNPDVIHPGKEEILTSQSLDEQIVLQELMDHKEGDVLFIKNMAHHIADLSPTFCLNFKNVFLIRDTAKILSSFAKVVPNPELKDIGIKQEWELYDYLLNQGRQPLVIDSGILLENPKAVLEGLCDNLDIPFKEQMLEWNPGPRKEDGVWAKHWYHNVHKTDSFKKQASSNDPLPEHLSEVNTAANYYYQKLFSQAIRP